MIKQTAIGLNSRGEVILPEFLPLITAPMLSVVNKHNIDIYLNNKIQVSLPRNINFEKDNEYVWNTYSFDKTEELFLRSIEEDFCYLPDKLLIDVANGNMPKLYQLIKNIKTVYPKIQIMSGNVSSVEAFEQLAKTGIDYIRVGIGGGSVCNTTTNVGVGQKNLAKLIKKCVKLRNQYNSINKDSYSDVKIVADGISSYIRYCGRKYGYHQNGYAAILKLLDSGADLVMIGGKFANLVKTEFDSKKHYGMSSHEAQKHYSNELKPSEGMVAQLTRRYSFKDWLYGSEKPDDYPFHMGFINAYKSYKSYVGKTN